MLPGGAADCKAIGECPYRAGEFAVAFAALRKSPPASRFSDEEGLSCK